MKKEFLAKEEMSSAMQTEEGTLVDSIQIPDIDINQQQSELTPPPIEPILSDVEIIVIPKNMKIKIAP